MIKPRFNRSSLLKSLEKRKKAINTVLIRQLKVLGEKCLNEARSKYTYIDDTGNLTSSFGYAIFFGGKSIQETFEGNAEGVSKAKKVVSDNANSNTNEVMLIVVAGMDYALAVESKGYDVLTPAEQLAEREFPKLMKNLIEKIDKAGI